MVDGRWCLVGGSGRCHCGRWSVGGGFILRHAKSYGIELQDNLNPLNHFTKTKVLVESHLEDLLKA